MKILVTGGAGFIGSHVVDLFVQNGHEVVILDNLSTGKADNVPDGVRLIEMDITNPDLDAIFARENFDAVNHHAAQIDVRISVNDPVFDAQVNILGSLNILECCLRHGVKKVQFASTGGALYGEQDYFPADEEHPIRPLSPYGIAKNTIERYLYYYHQVHGLEYAAMRYANVYGPRQNPHGEAGVVAIFCDRLIAGKEAVINGDGKQTRDYVYVGDVARASLLTLEPSLNTSMNIGTAVESDVNDIFRNLNAAGGFNVPEKHGPAKKGEQMRSVISWEKAKEVLRWEPTVYLEEGLKLTMEFFLGKYDRS
ncbi:UDP-glucose 4-epimerase [candidate division LCP-89 bacterium B3_LCP]|uniref:UDP-glucose 4-epimerase n=1 Tax=candidate division LCP-89 bacterium B3_LCP TaxID=2012998 RepID=A0A532V3L5_UNCL8|nr:MAG: UDP-glucose 4-epimerase [candidate division LCP-89 bacterium B3_LCP]